MLLKFVPVTDLCFNEFGEIRKVFCKKLVHETLTLYIQDWGLTQKLETRLTLDASTDITDSSR